jgi:hypothetical protein
MGCGGSKQMRFSAAQRAENRRLTKGLESALDVADGNLDGVIDENELRVLVNKPEVQEIMRIVQGKGEGKIMY